MYKYMISALVAFAFVLSSCADSSQPTSSAPPRPSVSDNAMNHYTYDANFWLYNPCCNEYVHITGTVRYIYKSGVYHFNISNLVGTSAGGDTYHGAYVINETWNYDPGATTITYTANVVLTSASGCSFKLKIMFHYTWDANGNLVVDNYTYEVECL